MCLPPPFNPFICIIRRGERCDVLEKVDRDMNVVASYFFALLTCTRKIDICVVMGNRHDAQHKFTLLGKTIKRIYYAQ